MEDVAENTTSVNDSLHALACDMDDAANKDLGLPKVENNTSYAMSGTVGESSKKATLDVSLSTLEESHHDDTGGEHKPDISSNTDTPTTLVHGGNEATLGVSLPTLQASHHDDTGGEHKPDAPSNTDTPTTLVHGGNEATFGVSLSTLEASHHDDTEGEHKHDAPSNTDTPTTLVHGGNEATLDVSLPRLEASHHDDTESKHKPDAPSSTDTPTTLVRGGNKATLDVSLSTLEASHHDDTEGEHKPDAPSSADTRTTLVHGGNEATLDVSLSTITEPHNKEVQTASDVQGERKPVPDGSSNDSEVETILVSDEEGEIKSSGSNSENNPPLLVDADGVKNECSDVEVWNDGCPLPSSGPTYSAWQNTDAAHSSGAEAISTQVSTAGCLPECEEPRSGCLPECEEPRSGCLPECEEPRCGCVNIESVMSSEHVSHAPSTSIIEDGTKVAGDEGFQNKIEGKSNEFNGIIRQSKLQRPDISIPY
jgi:hypothetical protein